MARRVQSKSLGTTNAQRPSPLSDYAASTLDKVRRARRVVAQTGPAGVLSVDQTTKPAVPVEPTDPIQPDPITPWNLTPGEMGGAQDAVDLSSVMPPAWRPVLNIPDRQPIPRVDMATAFQDRDSQINAAMGGSQGPVSVAPHASVQDPMLPDVNLPLDPNVPPEKRAVDKRRAQFPALLEPPATPTRDAAAEQQSAQDSLRVALAQPLLMALMGGDTNLALRNVGSGGAAALAGAGAGADQAFGQKVQQMQLEAQRRGNINQNLIAGYNAQSAQDRADEIAAQQDYDNKFEAWKTSETNRINEGRYNSQNERRKQGAQAAALAWISKIAGPTPEDTAQRQLAAYATLDPDLGLAPQYDASGQYIPVTSAQADAAIRTSQTGETYRTQIIPKEGEANRGNKVAVANILAGNRLATTKMRTDTMRAIAKWENDTRKSITDSVNSNRVDLALIGVGKDIELQNMKEAEKLALFERTYGVKPNSELGRQITAHKAKMEFYQRMVDHLTSEWFNVAEKKESDMDADEKLQTQNQIKDLSNKYFDALGEEQAALEDTMTQVHTSAGALGGGTGVVSETTKTTPSNKPTGQRVKEIYNNAKSARGGKVQPLPLPKKPAAKAGSKTKVIKPTNNVTPGGVHWQEVPG